MVIVQQGLLWALVLFLICGALYAVVMSVVGSCKIVHLRAEEAYRKRWRRDMDEVVGKHRKVG